MTGLKIIIIAQIVGCAFYYHEWFYNKIFY